ncbi:hypothetical protein D3C81_1535460 [compost metagenome]
MLHQAVAADPHLQHRAITARTGQRRAAQVALDRRLHRRRVTAVDGDAFGRLLLRRCRHVFDLRHLQRKRIVAGITRHQPTAAEQATQGIGGGVFTVDRQRTSTATQLTVDQHRNASGVAVLIQRVRQILCRNVQRHAQVRRHRVGHGVARRTAKQPPQTHPAHKPR